jgi:hypothetical protein
MAEACTQGPYFRTIVENPVIGYDIDRAEVAFSEFERRASSCDLGIVRWAISDVGFRGVARGTVAPGEDCLPFSTPSEPLVMLGHLGSCAEPEKMSCLGLMPSNPPPKWTCAPRAPLGGPCITDLNCLDGMHCEFIAPVGKCVERKPDGAACGQLLECQSLRCDMNGLCTAPTITDVYCLPY